MCGSPEDELNWFSVVLMGESHNAMQAEKLTTITTVKEHKQENGEFKMVSLVKTLKTRFELLSRVIPLTVAFITAKIVFHSLGWEPFTAGLMPLFVAALTGIVFLLGFILAGVFSDYKESEKIPGEIVGSLNAIWHEAYMLIKASGSSAGDELQKKVLDFIDMVNPEFLINKNGKLLELVDSFSDDFIRMDKEAPVPIMVRLRNEQNNLMKLLIRIKVIRDTSFGYSAQLAASLMVFLFALSLLLLRIEPFAEGLFNTSLFVFILVSIIFIIRDTDNPFEYEEDHTGIDEVSFDVLYDFKERILRMKI